MHRNVLRRPQSQRYYRMSSGRRERRNTSDDDDADFSSWTHLGRQDETSSGGVGLGGVTDTKFSSDKRFTLDPDVESDALVSCAADEQSCLRPGSLNAHRLSPSLGAKDGTSSGLQESISTSGSGYYVRTAGAGRPTAGETVMLTSRGATTNWNNTVVLPVNDQRTLPVTSPQVSLEL